MRSIASISRATLDPERHCTPLDLQACSIVWAIKRLRGYLWGTKSRILSDHKALERTRKVGDYNARIQRWLEVFAGFDYITEYRKGQCRRKFLFPAPLARTCDGKQPQWTLRAQLFK